MSTIKKVIIAGLILIASTASIFIFPKTLDLYQNVGGGSGTITKLPTSIAYGTSFDIPYMNSAGTGFEYKGGYFEYNPNRFYLDLQTTNGGEDGALYMTAKQGSTIFTNFNQTFDTFTKYVLDSELFTTGFAADRGSWGSDGNYFGVKYSLDDAEWGKVLYKSSDGYIRSPNYPIDGTAGINIDTRDGGFLIGDLLGAGDNILLQVGSGQVVFGNYSNTSLYLDDPSGQIIYAFGAINKIFTNSGGVQIQPGSSTTDVAYVGGKIHSNTTTVGNIGTGEDDLMTYSIGANTLDTNQQSITGRASGTIANSINAKRLRFKYGSTTCMDTGAAGIPVSTAISWTLEFEIIRTGATTQKCNANLSTNNATLASYVGYSTAGETLSGAVTLKLTGEATTNNDVVEETLTVNWEPQA